MGNQRAGAILYVLQRSFLPVKVHFNIICKNSRTANNEYTHKPTKAQQLSGCYASLYALFLTNAMEWKRNNYSSTKWQDSVMQVSFWIGRKLSMEGDSTVFHHGYGSYSIKLFSFSCKLSTSLFSVSVFSSTGFCISSLITRHPSMYVDPSKLLTTHPPSAPFKFWKISDLWSSFMLCFSYRT